jgi:hypothetical protein
METSLENTKKIQIEENVYLWLKAIAKDKGLTANEYANQLLKSAEATRYKPTTLAEDLKNPKVQWFVPKNGFVLATIISDEHYKRLRRWLIKDKPLRLSTGSQNELIIENQQIMDRHNLAQAILAQKLKKPKPRKRVDVAIDAGLVAEAKKRNVNIEEATMAHFEDVKRSFP